MSISFQEFHCIVTNVIYAAVAFFALFLLQLFQHEIQAKLRGPDEGSLRYSFVSRAFCIVLGSFDICYWKGLWDGVNCLFGERWETATVTASMGLMGLFLSGSSRSMILAPMGVKLDIAANSCATSTVLRKDKFDPWKNRIGDVLYSILIETMVILAWHGLWSFYDIVLPFDIIPNWWSFVSNHNIIF